MTRAEALRWWRGGYQAGQQARLDALLLEAIAALAGLFSGPDHPGNHPA